MKIQSQEIIDYSLPSTCHCYSQYCGKDIHKHYKIRIDLLRIDIDLRFLDGEELEILVYQRPRFFGLEKIYGPFTLSIKQSDH